METKRIIIYNSSSFGGCFDYALYLAPALAKANGKEGTSALPLILVPDTVRIPNGLPLLMPDVLNKHYNVVIRKAYFLLRNLVNPLRLYSCLKKTEAGSINKEPSNTLVIFNDFEQLSAPIWVYFLSKLRPNMQFGIILHDPDRDGYIMGKKYATYCMKRIMALMSLAIYHEQLPDKTYYHKRPDLKYVKVPHGIYPAPIADVAMTHYLKSLRHNNDQIFCTILGNVRHEKNYNMVIDALAKFPHLHLIIAGQASNTAVDLDAFKQQAELLAVDGRVYFIPKYLTHEELSSIIGFSDAILLYYAKTFTSQSGILNTIAPFRKQVLISNGPSSLAAIAKSFKLGILAEPDNQTSLEEGLQKLVPLQKNETNDTFVNAGWDAYLAYASWDVAAEAIIEASREIS